MFYFKDHWPTEDYEDDERYEYIDDEIFGITKTARRIKVSMFLMGLLYIFFTHSDKSMDFCSFLFQQASSWTASSGFSLYPVSYYNFYDSEYLTDLYQNSNRAGYYTVSDCVWSVFVSVYNTDFFQFLSLCNENFEEYLRTSANLWVRFFDWFDLVDFTVLKYWLFFLLLWFLWYLWARWMTTILVADDSWFEVEGDDSFASLGEVRERYLDAVKKKPTRVYFKGFWGGVLNSRFRVNQFFRWIFWRPDSWFFRKTKKYYAKHLFSYWYTVDVRIKLTATKFKNFRPSTWGYDEWAFYNDDFDLIILRESGLMLSNWYCIPAWIMIILTFVEFGTFFDDDFSFVLTHIVGDAEDSFFFDWRYSFGAVYKTIEQLTLGDFEFLETPQMDMEGNIYHMNESIINLTTPMTRMDHETFSYQDLERRQHYRNQSLNFLYKFLEVYFSFINSHVIKENATNSFFNFFFSGGSIWDGLFFEGFDFVENLFWWNSPNTQYYLSLSNTSAWPGAWKALFDQDYFSAWAPLSYPWDFSWVFLNNVFVVLDNSLLAHSFLSSQDAFFFSYWNKWLAIHMEWSLNLIEELDLKFNLAEHYSQRLPLSTNKAVAVHLLQQYELTQLLGSTFFNKKEKILDMDKDLINNRLSFLIPESFYDMVPDYERVGKAAAVQKQQEYLKQVVPKVLGRIKKRERMSLSVAKSPWAWWESHLEARLRYYRTSKGYSGTYYYNHQILSKFDASRKWKLTPWVEKEYRVYDSQNYWSNVIIFYIWVLTGIFIPNKFYYYSLSWGDWSVEIGRFLKQYGVLFYNPYSIKDGLEYEINDDLSTDSKFAVDFVDTENYEGRLFDLKLMDFYVKSYLMRNRLSPNSNIYLFKNLNVDSFVETSLNKANLLNEVAHFMTDVTYGWGYELSKKNSYKNIFYGTFPSLYQKKLGYTPGFESGKTARPNLHNVGKSPIKIFLFQLLLDRYQLLFGRGLGTYYYLLPGWWKTRWFNYFLTYYSLEYKLVLNKNLDLDGKRLPDYYVKEPETVFLKKESASNLNTFTAKFVELEFEKFLNIVETIEGSFFELTGSGQDSSSVRGSNLSSSSLLSLNKIFYFGFLNFPSNFYLYTMLDLLSGVYEESSRRNLDDNVGVPYSPRLHNFNFDLLSSDLGIYLGYFGFLRNNLYNFNDHVVGHQYYKKQSDAFIWQKLLLSPWETFIFRLYGFYKNQVGLSYYYSNLSEDLTNASKSLQLIPQLRSIWNPSTSLPHYLNEFRYFKHYTSLSVNQDYSFNSSWDVYASSSGLRVAGAYLDNESDNSNGIPIFTQSGIDDFFRGVYDYKPLFLHENVHLISRELYYWGNAWYSKNFGGGYDSLNEFLDLDSVTTGLKYNKVSKIVEYSLVQE